MVAGVVMLLALISRLVTHPEAGHHHGGQDNVCSR